jgi:positive regulator of sigma E activity
MAARDPNVRRALVTRVSEDGETAWVLVEWMKAMKRARDSGAIQAGETPQGVEAVAIQGLQVGDEVLVDLRPLPIIWLSFLFFVGPILGFVGAAVLGHLLGAALHLAPALTLLIQVVLGGIVGYQAFRFADRQQRALQAEGQGTPLVTGIMPRFVGEQEGDQPGKKRDLLQAVFFLSRPVTDTDWEFAAAEFERISGLVSAERSNDRVEVIFQQGVLKEKHLLELLTMLNFPIVMERDPEA